MISILLPTYNSAEFLPESIHSILNQTFQDFELLIIDDGSTDNTKEIVKSFKDDRIIYLFKEHSGLANTLNYGLKSAKSDWIARMDSDDISHPKRLEKQVNILKSKLEIDWISNWYAVFTNIPSSIIRLPEDSESIRNNLILTSSICFPSSIFKKKVILNAGGFKGKVFEDYKLLLKVKDSCSFYNIQEVLYFQRKRKTSLSRDNFEEKKKIIYEIQKPYYKNLIDEFSLSSESDINYFKGWREFFYGDKYKARFYWKLLGVRILFYPKVIIGFCLTLFSVKNFVFLKKIGFKILFFYSPFVSTKIKNEFLKIRDYNF